MAIASEKVNKNLLQRFISIVEQDKKKKVPVIKFIRQGFPLELAQKFAKKEKLVHFIGVTGESASGKSTFVKTIIRKIQAIETTKNKSILNFISTDNYFNDISEKIKKHGSFDNFLLKENYNPDAPTSFKLDLMKQHLLKLSQRKNVYIPEYKIDGTGVSVENAILIEAAPVIMSEGIAVFYPTVRDLFDIRFYVEVDDEIRLERYLKRAIACRNQTELDAIKQYETINKSAKIHLRPQRKYADVIINGNAEISDIEEITEQFIRCF
ncbi:MAG: hypothetical protein K6A44_04670 [bacterium]|nr:hypothetical protein [bacterium]